MTTPAPRSTTLLALAALATLASGCVYAQRTETRYVITQRAALPAPGGPDAVGAMTPGGKVSAEGGARVTYAQQAETDRERAELGHLLMNRTFHGRLAFGIADRLEIGLSGQYGNTQWATASSDLTPNEDELTITHSVWGGLQARAVPLGDRLNGLGLFGELSVGRVPFKRHVETTTTRYDYTLLETEVTTTVEEETENSAEMHVMWRTGAQGFFSLGELLTITGGGMLQAMPRFWARRVAGQTCNDFLYDDQPASCNGDSPETMEPHNTMHFGTFFVGGSIGAGGPLSLHGQLYYHAIAPDVVRHTSPIGADLRLRLTF